MYSALFGITQYTSGYPYLVTNLLPLRLGCTFLPFARNITVPFTPSALPIQRTVIENLESLQFFFVSGYIVTENNLELTLNTKELALIQIRLKVVSITNKNITR